MLNPPTASRTLAAVQGLFYVATGIWPILSMRAFERVTGPKTDRWLVRTVGLLSIADGVVLLAASRSRDRRPEPLLGIAPALAFGGSSLWYRLRGRLNASYLLDAAAEATFVVAWAALARHRDVDPRPADQVSVRPDRYSRRSPRSWG